MEEVEEADQRAALQVVQGSEGREEHWKDAFGRLVRSLTLLEGPWACQA
jgi:hypothetical protein